MSDLIIYINDEAIDLLESQVIAITKQAAKVGDFSKVLADGTNQISVPATSRNKAIFQNAHLVQTESGLPYSRLSAKLVQEGVETIQEGFAIIETVDDTRYNLQVVGGNASFFILIKDKNLRDLDLKEFDHFWTNANVIGSQPNTEGFIYALMEQSQADQTPASQTLTDAPDTVHTELLLPSFFVKTLVERIFSEVGFDFVCDVQGSNQYEELTVFAASTPNRGIDLSFMNFTVECNAMYSGIGAFEFAPFQGNNTITQQGSSYWQYTVNPFVSAYLVSDNATIHFTAAFIMTNNDTVDNTGLLYIYHTNADGNATITIPFNIPVGTSTVIIDETFECVINPAGDCAFDLEHIFSALVDMEVGSTMSFEFEFISNNPITTSGNYYFIRGITPVPDMSQVDFLKDFARVFQLVFDTDEVNGVVTAKRFDEIKENIPLAIDYSAKMQEGSQQVKFTVDGYAKRNLLQWKPDDLTGYDGQSIIFIDNENLDYEKTVVQLSQFAATSHIQKLSMSVPKVSLFVAGEPSNKTTDRMFVINRVALSSPLDFDRYGSILSTSDVAVAFFSIAGNTDSLDFENLKSRFYQTLEQMLQKAVVITANFNLGIADVYSYNPFIPVYIQKFNSYFYLEKIENYLKGKLTKIKLIKL
jgi:hypothetical protein